MPQRKVGVFFERWKSKKKEGHKKVPDHHELAQVPPARRVAPQKVNGLFGNVRIPDQHVLAETDVGPENGEGEHELTHDVVVLMRHDLLQDSRLHAGR